MSQLQSFAADPPQSQFDFHFNPRVKHKSESTRLHAIPTTVKVTSETDLTQTVYKVTKML